MAAGDVAAFMGDDADDLIGCLGLHQQPGMDEHVLPIHDEGVEGAVVDDMDPDALRPEPRRGEDRLGVGSDQGLGFRVADDACGICCRRARKRDGKARHGGRPKYAPGFHYGEAYGRRHG